MSALPILTILKNGEKLSEHEIERDSSIGRDEGCVIRLEDRAISRNHAQLRVVTEGIQIEKKSQFGSLSINGEEKTSAVIKTGDLIALGPYLIKVQMPEAKKVEEPKVEIAPVAQPVTPSTDSSLGEELTSSNPEAESPPVEAEPGDSPPQEELPQDATPPLETAEVPAAESAPQEDLIAPQELAPSGENPFEDNSDGKTRVLSQSSTVLGRLVFEDGFGNQKEFIIDRDEISIGRARDCDLPIDDKRLSRKHILIQRMGIKFILKDLQSANGTFINDIQIQEQELESGNTIRIGDTQLLFEAISSDYQSTPASEESFESENFAGEVEQQPQGSLPYLGATPEHTQSIVGISSGKSAGKGTLIEQFKALPPKKRMIYGAVVLMFIFFIMDQEPEEAKKRVPASKQGVGQKVAPTFEKLSKKDKTFVSTQYQLAFDLYTSKQYDKAIYEVTKIFDLIPDYKDARDIQRYAEEGKRRLAAMEAENKKREEENKIRQKVAELEEEISKLIISKKYERAVELFPQVIELDPENVNVEKWQSQVDEYLAKKKQEEIKKQLIARLTEQAKGIREDAQAFFAKKSYRIAITKMNEALKLSPIEEKLKTQLTTETEEMIAALADEMNPLMADAKEKEEAKEFTAAYKLYDQAIALDPEDQSPKEGIERIRDTLHIKAKGLYTEGLLSESYSDFETAKNKYQDAKETAPADDEYFTKATNKLKKFEILNLAFPTAPRQPASAGPPEFSSADLAPGATPGVPTEKQLGVAPAGGSPGYKEQQPADPGADAPPQMPDFSQLLQGIGGGSGAGAPPPADTGGAP
ncbi:MAG: FHA domain-containing protein [Xanthomonadaceae bacterium]|nr:FHA domain-containing protein [Xanthomonadaceae bacterium]